MDGNFIINFRMERRMVKANIIYLISLYLKEFLSKIKSKVFFIYIQGFGRIIHANGDYFEGEVKNSKANG